MIKTLESNRWVRRLHAGFYALAFLVFSATAPAQFSAAKVARIQIRHVGPQSVGDELVKAQIRVKAGDQYFRAAIDDDIRNLYGTGFFYNIRVTDEITPDGVVLTYVLQGKPTVTEIRFSGNKKFSDKKLRKKISSKEAEPLDERKLFTDTQDIQKMYQKAGYPSTQINPKVVIDEQAGRGTVTFEIVENRKIKISGINFIGAQAFPESKLRRVIKTRKHWFLSWITGGGFLKEDVFEDDREKLAEFYRDHGYIDFEIKDVQILYPTPKTMEIRFLISEGRQYKVGSVTFTGNTLFSTQDITNGLKRFAKYEKGYDAGPNNLPMDVGSTFRPHGMTLDIQAVQDFYGSKGYIDVNPSTRNLEVVRVPNTETGTMDLEFRIDEGQRSYIEKIEIRGNVKTRDKVIRRELAVAPGETFDMVRVNLSRQRLQGLQYFERVDARPEPTTTPNRPNLVIGVDEKNTGHLTVGAGFSSVDAIVGFTEVTQGNFDLFNPPYFTGGGQKLRLRLQVGTERQDALISFIEPWFLGKRLALGVDLYYHNWRYQSLDDLYDETRIGARFSLTRALGSEFLIGSIYYNPEQIGIDLNEPESEVPQAILAEEGNSFASRFGASLAYDTRNSVELPNRGQRTEFLGELTGGPLGGDRDYYKLELRTGWYFRGLFPGHVLEIVGRTGIAESFGDTDDVPFYDRYYLGGMYTLRGFKYRRVSPREEGFREPIGGDTFWFGSAEYSIPVIDRLRFALFYDIGAVSADPYQWNSDYSDNFGFGIRLNLPIGPLRLDYGIPINRDEYNSGSGQFQFGVGWERPF